MCQLCSWARRSPTSKRASSLLSTTAQFSQTVHSLKPTRQQSESSDADAAMGRSPVPSSQQVSTEDQPRE
ncbi:MAG TPA: hypothetical protein ACFE0H_12055 [Elainellaceae cyanobacterium]